MVHLLSNRLRHISKLRELYFMDNNEINLKKYTVRLRTKADLGVHWWVLTYSLVEPQAL
jgi:hypothetical protein